MRIYTRRGDDGTTGALFGGRFSKSGARAEATGSIDEAVAALGVARAASPRDGEAAAVFMDLQRRLFVAGAEVATLPQNRSRLEDGVSLVSAGMVAALEDQIDATVARSPLPGYFVLPGGTPVSAALDLARAVVRRAERAVVALKEAGEMEGSHVPAFLNRFSDLLFVLARAEEAAAGIHAPPSRTTEAEGAGAG